MSICVYIYVYLFLYWYCNRMQEKYEQMKTDTNVHVGSDADDHLLLKACSGWSNKGTIYGLGQQGPSMFKRPAKVRQGSSSTSSAYTSHLVTELQGQL